MSPYCSEMSNVPVIKPALRPWQVAALVEWHSAGRRGIVAAATGTGKTRVAVQALAELTPDWVGVIVVPTKALQAQWVDVLTRQLQIHPRKIGTLGGDAPDFDFGRPYVVAVLNSARERLPAIVDHWRQAKTRTLLVVDECHRVGAPETAAALWSTSYDAALGLSATPERGDDGLDDVLSPSIGPVIYRYSQRAALADGVLSPLVAVNLYLDLTDLEMGEYREFEIRIQRQVSAGMSATDPAIQRLRTLQQSVSRRATGRHVALRSLVHAGLLHDRRTLLFHETIDQAEVTSGTLSDAGIRYAVEHSKLNGDVRSAALRRFASGSVDALVTVRALDEGIDVPAANTAVIVSGTMNPRQRIQRAGRIVRPSGDAALLVSLLARGTAEEIEVGGRDAALFGNSRVNHFATWNSREARPIVALLQSLVSSGT